MTAVTRRSALLAIATVALAQSGPARGEPVMRVHKDPGCGCCDAWIDHLRAEGFRTDVVVTAAINRLKGEMGVPKDLFSCHTAQIDGYVIEGHVPAAEIRRLLRERPAASGIAVAGMPIGSPGMEVPGVAPEVYDVVLFGRARRPEVFARYRGGVRA